MAEVPKKAPAPAPAPMPVVPRPTVTTSGVRPGQVVGSKPAVRAAAFKIEPVSRKTRYLKLLVYGPYGVGKTLLSATSALVPIMRDVLIMNAEAGDLTLSDFQDDYNVSLDNIEVQDFHALGRANEYLKRHCQFRDANDIEGLRNLQAQVSGVPAEEIADEDIKQYRTVIIDSITEVEQYCFNQLLGITSSMRLDEEGQSAEWTEYKKNHNMMLRLVRAFRDLPMHVVFICAASYVQDELKRMKYSPDLTGKLSNKIQGFMDMVGYYVKIKDDAGKEERRLYVTSTPRFDAKHRYTAFKGDYFANPTIGSILKEVNLLSADGATLK